MCSNSFEDKTECNTSLKLECKFSIVFQWSNDPTYQRKSQNSVSQYTINWTPIGVGSVCPSDLGQVALFFCFLLVTFSTTLELSFYGTTNHDFVDHGIAVCVRVCLCCRVRVQPFNQMFMVYNGRATNTSLSSTLGNYNRSIDHSRILCLLVFRAPNKSEQPKQCAIRSVLFVSLAMLSCNSIHLHMKTININVYHGPQSID